MAGTITVNVSASIVNSPLRDSFAPGAISVTQTTMGRHSPITVVGTSEEDLSFGDITTPGWVFIQNLDSTNFVTYGPKSGGVMVAFGKIKAGEVACLRIDPTITWRWKADTASVKVDTRVFEN